MPTLPPNLYDRKEKRNQQPALHQERLRQIRGLTLLALAIIFFAIARAGLARVFTTGWWRLW